MEKWVSKTLYYGRGTEAYSLLGSTGIWGKYSRICGRFSRMLILRDELIYESLKFPPVLLELNLCSLRSPPQFLMGAYWLLKVTYRNPLWVPRFTMINLAGFVSLILKHHPLWVGLPNRPRRRGPDNRDRQTLDK
jgi:hypothetical protein